MKLTEFYMYFIGKKPRLLFDQSFDANQYKLIENLFGEALKEKECQELLIEY